MSRILQSASERRAETHPLTWRLHDDQSPVLLDEYRSTQGYEAVTKALEQHTYESLTEEVKTANLRGRGGAGFSAGFKWSLTMKGEDVPRGYIVCNADEMEPGTFKDRLLMEQQPHLPSLSETQQRRGRTRQWRPMRRC